MREAGFLGMETVLVQALGVRHFLQPESAVYTELGWIWKHRRREGWILGVN